MTELPQRVDDERRRALLAQAVQQQVVFGARVQSQDDRQAVVVRGKPVNHVLHLLLTLVTCGLWGLVWVVLVISGGESRHVVSVDDWGNVLVQKV